MIAVDPTLIRKAAAFVEAIERVESDFGIDLDAPVPVTFTAGEVTFGLVRVPGEERRLALAFPAPPRTPEPRVAIHGRD